MNYFQYRNATGNMTFNNKIVPYTVENYKLVHRSNVIFKRSEQFKPYFIANTCETTLDMASSSVISCLEMI